MVIRSIGTSSCQSTIGHDWRSPDLTLYAIHEFLETMLIAS